MAQADQHTSTTPIEWSLDEDRWTLNQAFRHLTVTLGYSKKRARDEMEQARLDRRLLIKVQKVVDGKPQGDPYYLPSNKTHELVHHQGWVFPLGLPWGDYRCTVYKQRVLELWPRQPPASQSAPSPPATVQRRPAKESKPDSGTKSGRIPLSARRDAAIKNRLVNGESPDSILGGWKKFYATVRIDCDAFVGDPKNQKYKRGFSDDSIKRATRRLMESLPHQA